MLPEMIESTAVFSEDRIYRYVLKRAWNLDKGICSFICLNPSTADEMLNDATVVLCIEHAHFWGFGTFYMLNLFSFRATKPPDMFAAKEPVGADNDRWIREIVATSDLVVATWGNAGSYLGRSEKVLGMVPNVAVLGMTKAGQPHHPLYLRKGIYPVSIEGTAIDVPGRNESRRIKSW